MAGAFVVCGLPVPDRHGGADVHRQPPNTGLRPARFFSFSKGAAYWLAIFLFMPTAVFLLFISAILIVPPESILLILKTDHQIVVWVLAILAIQFVFRCLKASCWGS